MRTLIDIQDELMEELLRTSKARTKKEAITLAIRNYLKQKKREELEKMLGHYDFGYTTRELEEMRKDG